MLDLNVKFYFGLIDAPDESMLSNSIEHTEYIRILNSENGDPRFKSRMKNIIKDAYRKHINQNNTVVSKVEYLLEYVVEANMSIFQYWFMNRDKDFPRISLKDIREIIQYVDQNGFKKAFETFADK